MADASNDPWNILKGFMGIPQPPSAPANPQSFMDNYGSSFPANITGGRLLAVPLGATASVNVNLWQGAGPSMTVNHTPTAPGIGGGNFPTPPQSVVASPPPIGPDARSPSLDEIAMSPTFNFSPQTLSAIRSDAEFQVGLQHVMGEGASLAADGLFPETDGRAGDLVSGTIDILNGVTGLTEQQRIENSYNDRLQKQLNDVMVMRTNGGRLPPFIGGQ